MIFLLRKSLKIFSGSNLFCCGLTFDLFKLSSFSLLKGRQTPLSNSKNVKATKNVIDF